MSVTMRREEVGTASEQKADEEDRGLLAGLLYSQMDSERPIDTIVCGAEHKMNKGRVTSEETCGEERQNSS